MSNPQQGEGARLASRKIARLACSSCRTRKSRCDEAKPICGTCSRLKLRCEYGPRTRARIHASESPFITDSILDQHAAENDQSPTVSVPGNYERSRRGRSLSTTADLHSSQSLLVMPMPAATSPVECEISITPREMPTLPIEIDFANSGHVTAAHKIFAWPRIKQAMPGIDLKYPLSLELAREPLISSVAPPRCLAAAAATLHGDQSWLDSLTLGQTRTLLRHYLDEYYPVYPIADSMSIRETCMAVVVGRGFGQNSQSCLVLLIFAIGSFVAYHKGESNWGSENVNDSQEPPGIGFFNRARQFIAFLPRGKIETAQCYFLAGLYQAQLLRVHDFWTYIHNAAIIVINLLSTAATTIDNAPLRRAYWSIYILESTILAEVDFPASGISRLQDNVALPFGDEASPIPNSSSASNECNDTDSQFILLANIALRRLINRLYPLIYASSCSDDLGVGITEPSTLITQEFMLQIERWYDHLPESISHVIESGNKIDQSPSNMLGLLRARYWVTRFLLLRPYVYRATSAPAANSTEEDLSRMNECLDAGFRVAQEIGLHKATSRLILSPFAPFRTFMAAYVLLCAVHDTPHLRWCSNPKWKIADKILQAVSANFIHASPLIAYEIGLLTRYRSYLVNKGVLPEIASGSDFE